eukprot:1884731-Amphidinium_carterae.1
MRTKIITDWLVLWPKMIPSDFTASDLLYVTTSIGLNPVDVEPQQMLTSRYLRSMSVQRTPT